MTLALEINDVGLVLASEGAVLAEEPGIAMLDGPVPETGAAAVRRARLKPLYAETRHWQDLGTDPLPRPMPAAGTLAEVAYAQVVALARPYLALGPEVLLAVPPWYSRQQLALLLGVVGEAGLRPVGLVDAGLAAAAVEPAPDSLLHLELGLHRAAVTALDRAGDLRRTRFELLPQHGWIALQQAWLDMVASAFVRQTRFDPLHQAATEQRLSDSLPGWLETLDARDMVTIELEAAGETFAIELTRADFEAAASRIWDELARVVQRARPSGGPLELRLSHRLAQLPGLESRLAGIRDCEMVRLPRGAAALGALAFESSLRGHDGNLTLVQHLPVAARATAWRPSRKAAAISAQDRPTHLVLASRAYRLDGTPLTLGAEVPRDRRGLALPAGPGISRTHCTLTREDDAVWLDDHSTFGTLVNGERVAGRVELRAGDRLRIGSPGVECELVRAVDDDGAA
jgi:hypothetical protein